MVNTKAVFGRVNTEGNIDILAVNSGSPITRIDANVYPVGKLLSVRYEHPNGITLTREDAEKLGIEIEE